MNFYTQCDSLFLPISILELLFYFWSVLYFGFFTCFIVMWVKLFNKRKVNEKKKTKCFIIDSIYCSFVVVVVCVQNFEQLCVGSSVFFRFVYFFFVCLIVFTVEYLTLISSLTIIARNARTQVKLSTIVSKTLLHSIIHSSTVHNSLFALFILFIIL